MKLAAIDGQRVTPSSGLRAHCQNCGAPVTAKCGSYKIWHWAYKTREHCDPWWEAEGEWHRSWKERFPQEWQEVPHQSATGERHIADIRTPAGLVIEFQRSTIDPNEVRARQAYYVKLIWVGFAQFAVFGRSKLFERWHTEKPVFIDFGNPLFWRIAHYNPNARRGVALIVDSDAFVRAAGSGSTDFGGQGGPAAAL